MNLNQQIINHLQHVTSPSIIGINIRESLKESPVPAIMLAKEVQDQIAKNEISMCFIIGNKAVEFIKTLQLNNN